jgi:hypothetical protein
VTSLINLDNLTTREDLEAALAEIEEARVEITRRIKAILPDTSHTREINAALAAYGVQMEFIRPNGKGSVWKAGPFDVKLDARGYVAGWSGRGAVSTVNSGKWGTTSKESKDSMVEYITRNESPTDKHSKLFR